jgi:hypothetical protein
MKQPLIFMLVVDLILLLFGVFSTTWFGFHQLRMFSFTTASIGIITFLGFFYVMYEPGLAIEGAMRNSITASVIAMFLVTVGVVTFFSTIAPKPGDPTPTLSPLSQTMIDSFKTVVTVVIGFYFTSSAVVEGIQRNKTGSLQNETKTQPPPPASG